MRRGWHVLLVAALTTSLVAACAPARPVRELPAADREVLLERVRKLADTHSSLRGLAKVRVDAGEERRVGNQVLLAERPDRFRVEVLTMFGSPLAILASDGIQLSVMLPGQGEFYRGAASPANLSRFTRLPLAGNDLVGLLLYQPPLVNAQEVRAEATDEGSRLVIGGRGSVRQELDFDTRQRVVASRYIDPAGVLQLAVRYGDFAAGNDFPARIRLQVPEANVEADVSFSELEIDVPLKDQLFRLEPLAGQEVRPLP